MSTYQMGISPSTPCGNPDMIKFLLNTAVSFLLSLSLLAIAIMADHWVIFSDINALILDYLTMEGYPKAAAKFSKEANLHPQQDEESIRTRQEIQRSIHAGNIESAIEALNELDPEVSRVFWFVPGIPMIRN